MPLTLEEQALRIQQEYQKDGEPCTYEEALEVAKMEQGAKEIKHYEKAEVVANKPRKTRPLDETKVNIVNTIAEHIPYEVEITNPQREITFTLGGKAYSLILTQHR